VAYDFVDLRSDTMTQPTPEMREAMARAEVGDDVWEEDPTVKRLEAMAAARVGTESALFVSSGTMGNLLSILAQTHSGQEVVLDLDSHIFNSEVGGAAVIGGVQMLPVKTERGFLTPDQVKSAVRPANIHIAPTGLVCLENTHNRHGGTCCTPEEIAAVAAVAHAAGVPVHLDGARLFNAAVALKREAREFVQHVDSVTFCVSKGLSAPVGSLICGAATFVERAKRFRKMVGGGMRQAGIIAAAGIVSLERMVNRLADDHANARTLAEAVAKMPGLRVDLASVQTNIVVIRVDRGDAARSATATQELVTGCAARKVKIHAMGPAAIRCVTHKDVDAEDIRRAIDAMSELTARW
jgi:threonine aldolase